MMAAAGQLVALFNSQNEQENNIQSKQKDRQQNAELRCDQQSQHFHSSSASSLQPAMAQQPTIVQQPATTQQNVTSAVYDGASATKRK